MWGLIYKDIAASKKTLLLSFIGMAVLTALFSVSILVIDDAESEIKNVSEIISLLIICCAFLCWIDIPTTLIRNDEFGHWKKFVSSSQASVEGEIQSKYVFPFIILVAVVNYLYFVLQIDDMIFYSVIGMTGMAGMISIAILAASLIMIVWSVEIPFLVYFGSRTGGYVKLIFTGVVVLGIIIYGLYGKTEISFDKLYGFLLSQNSESRVLAKMLAFQAISAAMYYFSYKLSCFLYRRGADDFG